MRLRGPVFCGQHNSVCYQINVEGARRNVWINCLNRKFSRLVRQGYQTVSDAVDDRSSAMGLQRRQVERPSFEGKSRHGTASARREVPLAVIRGLSGRPRAAKRRREGQKRTNSSEQLLKDLDSVKNTFGPPSLLEAA